MLINDIKKCVVNFMGALPKICQRKKSEASSDDDEEVNMENFVFINAINQNACDRKP